MAPTLEQKRKMRIARKKRKKLMRMEERKAKQRAVNVKEIEATVAATREEASRERQLASKYYRMWKKCSTQKKDISKLLEKKESVSLNLHTST